MHHQHHQQDLKQTISVICTYVERLNLPGVYVVSLPACIVKSYTATGVKYRSHHRQTTEGKGSINILSHSYCLEAAIDMIRKSEDDRIRTGRISLPQNNIMAI